MDALFGPHVTMGESAFDLPYRPQSRLSGVPPLATILDILPEDCRTLAALLAAGHTAKQCAVWLGGETVQRLTTRLARILAQWADHTERVPHRWDADPPSDIPRCGKRWEPVARPRSIGETTRTTGGWHIDQSGRFHPWDN